MNDKQKELINALFAAVPYPHLISNIDLEDDDTIRFSWRGTRYRCAYPGHVEVSEDGVLIGCDAAILMGKIIERAVYNASFVEHK